MIKGHVVGTNGNIAKVSDWGQLVVGALEYSSFYNALADTNDVPVNVIPPKSNKRFVITAIIVYANKNVSANTDATVTIYEGTGPTTAKASTDITIFTQDVPQKNTLTLTGLNIIVSEGVWVNGVTNDDDVQFNISGYYIDA